MSQLFCCTKFCIPDKKEEEIDLNNLPIIKIESPNRRSSRLINNFDTEPQQIKIEDDLKLYIFSQRHNTIPKSDKVLSSSNRNEIIVSERTALTSQGDKEKISQKHLDKIKEICAEMKVKLSKKGTSGEKISEKISMKKSTSLTPIKSVYNGSGSQSSNACSQTVANTPGVNNAISIEGSVNKLKVEKLNEALKQTVIRKSPMSKSNFNTSTNKKNFSGYKQDDLSEAYNKISRRKIEVEYDQDAVYGKPSNKDKQTRTIEGEKGSKNEYEYEGDLQEVKKKIEEEEEVVNNVIDEGEAEYVKDQRVGRIKKNKNSVGVRVKENINLLAAENMTHNVKSNPKNQSNILKDINNNPHIRNENKDRIKSIKDNNQVDYSNHLDQSKASKNLHTQSPKKNRNTSYINAGFSNKNYEQPTNFAVPEQMNKQLNNSSYSNINSYNKNFDILLGQSHTNHKNRDENYPQQFENFTARPNNINYYQMDRNEASPYNMMNNRNSFELNNSYQFHPNHSQPLNYNPNYNFSHTNPQNYYAFRNAPNTVNYLSDNSQLSSFSYNTVNGVSGFNPINPIGQIAPYSCPNCEHIYKNSIFNNIPLNLMKCMCCQNVINSVSLDFYLKKYREELFQYRKNSLKEKEKIDVLPREAQYDNRKNSYHASPNAELKAKKLVEQAANMKNKNINRTMNELDHEDRAELKINSSSKQTSLSTSKETLRHDKGTLTNKKKYNQVYADDIQEISKVGDKWVDWIEEKKKEVKKNIAFTVPFTTGMKEKKNDPAKIDSGNDNDDIVNDGTTLSEMFKNKKKEFLNKIENRKKIEKKDEKVEKENIPKEIVLVGQDISRKDLSPKNESKSHRDSKKVESINFNEKKQEKNPKNKNSKEKEKLTKNIKKKEEFTKRKEKQIEFANKLKQDLNKKNQES